MGTPISEWIWDGHAAHLFVSEDCQFHMATRIGNYIISTVGEYLPKGEGKTRFTPPMDGVVPDGVDYSVYKEVGLHRLFETYVFHAKGEGMGNISDWGEIDSLPANDHDTARKNHMDLCKKYARKNK